MITISSPDQLNDALINERLGLDYYQQRQLPAGSNAHNGSRDTQSTPISTQKDDLPPLPSSVVLAEPITHTANSSTSVPQSLKHSAPAASPQAQSQPHHPATPTTTGRQVSHPVPIQNAQDPIASRHVRNASGTGIGSSSEATADRQRKTSLTARLGKAFGNPAMQSRTSDSPSEGSPTSASGSSRIKSSFSKAFRRTSDSTSPQQSPRADTYTAPPVPPKDDLPARPTVQTKASPAGTYRTPSGGVGYIPPIGSSAPKEDGVGPSSSAGTFPEAVSRLYPAQSNENHLSPSPSAKRIMTEARIKSVSKEEEIQNRFRRDLHLDDGQAGEKEEVDDEDDDVRLPYDTSDHSVSDHLKHDGPDDTPNTGNTAGPSMQIPRKPVDYGVIDPDQRAAHTDTRPLEDSSSHEPISESQVSPEVNVSEHTRSPENRTGPAELDHDSSSQLLTEEGHREEEESRRLRQEAEEEAVRQTQSDDLARQVEAQRVQELQARERQEAEDRQRAEAAAELQRHAEEHALQKEAERQRELEEQERRDAEARRLREELERQRKEEEEEKLRLDLEEHRRLEQVRLAEEEARRKQEEERRIEAEKQEAERARKEGITKTLRDGKQNGGIMLRGVSRRSRVVRLPLIFTACHSTDHEKPNLASALLPFAIRRDAVVQERACTLICLLRSASP